MLGLSEVTVVGGADRGIGTLLGVVRKNEDHVHPVPAMVHRTVRLVRADPVYGHQGAVNDDVVAFTATLRLVSEP